MKNSWKDKSLFVKEWLSELDVGDLRGEEIGLNQQLSRIENTVRLGLPSNSFLPAKIGSRIWFIPYGIPNGRSLAVACSRIGKYPHEKKFVFDGLRTLCSRFDSRNRFLVSHVGTAVHKYVERASQLFDLPLLELCPIPTNPSLNWCAKVLGRESTKFVAYYDCQHMPLENSEGPDSLTIDVVKDLYLLSVRPNGKIFQSTLNRLRRESSNRSTTFVLNSNEITASIGKKLKDAGAVEWYLYSDENENQQDSSRLTVEIDAVEIRRDLSRYLVHWTRRCKGPWPEQSEEQFVDDLILGLDRSDHSKYSTLKRIVASSTLLADNKVTRDSTPVVSFSEVPIDELPRLRAFRPHLSRWDFETVGLAIKKSVLQKLGCREVIYGTDKDWSQLEKRNRPFFQIARSGRIDWQIEREWRIIGSLDLKRIGPNDAFVFVDDKVEAGKVARISKWPVVLLDPQGKSPVAKEFP